MDSRIELLLDVLDRAFDKPGWYGPNLSSSIRGVDPKTAAKSILGRKSIWEQVLHAAYWKQRVLNKLIGTQPFPRRGSNWPKLPSPISSQAWKDDVELLHDIHRRFRKTIADVDWDTLTPKLLMMIHGAAAHDVYHTGQIRLLRRM